MAKTASQSVRRCSVGLWHRDLEKFSRWSAEIRGCPESCGSSVGSHHSFSGSVLSACLGWGTSLAGLVVGQSTSDLAPDGGKEDRHVPVAFDPPERAFGFERADSLARHSSELPKQARHRSSSLL